MGAIQTQALTGFMRGPQLSILLRPTAEREKTAGKLGQGTYDGVAYCDRYATPRCSEMSSLASGRGRARLNIGQGFPMKDGPPGSVYLLSLFFVSPLSPPFFLGAGGGGEVCCFFLFLFLLLGFSFLGVVVVFFLGVGVFFFFLLGGGRFLGWVWGGGGGGGFPLGGVFWGGGFCIFSGMLKAERAPSRGRQNVPAGKN